jgi:hypothetical protein
MLHKICFISFILIFICLYLYVKIESFANPTDSNIPISAQLTSEIARVLGVSTRRITKLLYTGDISAGALGVSFTILEPIAIEIKNNEKIKKKVSDLEDKLFKSKSFKVFINGFNILLYKISEPKTNDENYFDNNGLKDISKYSNKKYNSVPNDASLTNFYKLEFDRNFNIMPKLYPVTTTAFQIIPTKPLNFA